MNDWWKRGSIFRSYNLGYEAFYKHLVFFLSNICEKNHLGIDDTLLFNLSVDYGYILYYFSLMISRFQFIIEGNDCALDTVELLYCKDDSFRSVTWESQGASWSIVFPWRGGINSYYNDLDGTSCESSLTWVFINRTGSIREP